MLLDANILLYAVDQRSPHHERASAWLIDAMTGAQRIALPWQTIGAFVRITTHPRILAHPLSTEDAWTIVEQWLAAPQVWIPPPTERTADLLGQLVRRHHLSGNAIPDAQLAALAIENGIAIVSADTDFARFPDVRWINPLTLR